MSAKFSLAGLLRLRRLEEDLRAAELNSARSHEEVGLARTRRIRNSLANSTEDPTAHASLASIAATRASSATMLSELGEVDRANAAEVQLAAAAHADAHRKTLGLEKLEARFEEKLRAEELRDEQLLLDDLSSRAWHAAQGEVAPVSIDTVSLQTIQATFNQLSGATAKSTDSNELFAKLIAALQTKDAAAAPTSTTATGSGIVAAAAKYEGVPYVFGGTSSNGIDCTGLVQKALADAGITVGRSMDDQMTAGTEVGKLADAKPGDLIVLDGGAHIVIYSGNGNVIHAPYEGRTVTEQKIWFDQSDVVTIRRVAPDAAAQPAASSTTGTNFSSGTDALQALINAQASILSRSIS